MSEMPRCVYQVDLDLGNYERFMDLTLHKDNNITTGKIYQVGSVSRSCCALGLKHNYRSDNHTMQGFNLHDSMKEREDSKKRQRTA